MPGVKYTSPLYRGENVRSGCLPFLARLKAGLPHPCPSSSQAVKHGRRALIRRRRGQTAPSPAFDGSLAWTRCVRLTCPLCGVSVEILAGCAAWCTRCPGRPELLELAT